MSNQYVNSLTTEKIDNIKAKDALLAIVEKAINKSIKKNDNNVDEETLKNTKVNLKSVI